MDKRPHQPGFREYGSMTTGGIAEGVWSSPAEAAAAWHADAEFHPAMSPDEVNRRAEEWHRGVERARGWAAPGPPT